MSIDVDGNDYWFLESLVDIAPSIIIVEYNASLGARSVTVPYDPGFDRSQKHPTGWHHGASLQTLAQRRPEVVEIGEFLDHLKGRGEIITKPWGKGTSSNGNEAFVFCVELRDDDNTALWIRVRYF